MSARFPRSMREAFPAERYASIEVTAPVRSIGDRAVAWTLVAAALVAVVLMAGGWA